MKEREFGKNVFSLATLGIASLLSFIIFFIRPGDSSFLFVVLLTGILIFLLLSIGFSRVFLPHFSSSQPFALLAAHPIDFAIPVNALSSDEGTAPTEAEKKLWESEKKFRSIIENSVVGIITIDLKGKIVLFNPGAELMFGYKAEELLGGNVKTLLSPPFHRDHVFYINKFLETGKRKYITRGMEAEALRKDGSSFTVFLTVFEIAYRDGLHFTAIVQDISDRKKSEEALRKLARAVEQSPSIVMVTDLHGDIEYVNPKFTEVTGYHPDEVLGKNPRLLKSGHTSPEEYQKLWQDISAGREWKGEFLNRKKNGDVYWESVSISPVFSQEKEITHYVALKEDITIRRGREVELAIAKKEAEEANFAKSDFLARMSHEIRTPLNGILGMTQLALSTNLSEKQRNFIEKIDSSSQTLLALINDILDFSKIEAGKIDLEKVEFRYDELLDKLYSLFLPKAEEKGIKIGFPLEKGVPPCMIGDPLRLEQILNNLISNAIKFTEKGEVLVTTSLEKENKEQVFVKITVLDSGIGIPPVKIGTLFSCFTQADESISRKYGGTGLGLAICKKLTELLGGKIDVKSRWGEGTVFTVKLPFTKAPMGPASKTEPLPIYSSGKGENLSGLHLLLTEDNEINQEVARELLSSMGVKVTLTCNGREALNALERGSFHLILMDVQMPVLDGYETTRIIRGFPLHDNLPIIAMTAQAMDDDRKRCLEAGMNDYISKPINPEELYKTLIRWKGKIFPFSSPPSSLPALDKKQLDHQVEEFEEVGGLDVKLALSRVGGNRKIYGRLLVNFLKVHRSAPFRLKKYFEKNQRKKALFLLHSFKGASGNISALKLSRLAEELEEAFSNSMEKFIPSLIGELETAIEEVTASVENLDKRNYLGTPGKAESPASDRPL